MHFDFVASGGEVLDYSFLDWDSNMVKYYFNVAVLFNK
jgi:hypothetical protein